MTEMQDDSLQLATDPMTSSINAPVIKISTVGNESSRERIIPLQGTMNADQWAFNWTMSRGQILDRVVMLKTEVKITINGHTNNEDLALRCCPVAFPVNSGIRTLSVGVNGWKSTCSPSRFMPAFQHLIDEDIRKLYYSESPTQPDEWASNTANANTEDLPGGAYNPHSPGSRANFRMKSYTKTAAGAGNVASYEIVYEFTEALHHPVFTGSEFEEGLSNINSVEVMINWTNLKAMFAGDPSGSNGANPVVITTTPDANITVEFPATNKPELLIREYTPSQQINQITSHHYAELIPKPPFQFSNAMGATDGAGDVDPATPLRASVSTGEVSYNVVPNMLYMFALSRGEKNTVTDSFSLATIERVNISTTSNQGKYASARPSALHQMSVRGGSSQSLDDWYKQGSLLCIDLSKDWGSVVPGTRSPFSFSVDMDISFNAYELSTIADDVKYHYGKRAINKAALEYDLYIFGVVDGQIVLSSDGSASVNIGHSVSEVVESSTEKEPLQLESYRPRGSGFWSTLGKKLKLAGAIGSLVPPLRPAAALAGTAGTILAGGNSVNVGGSTIRVGGKSALASLRN